MGQGHAKDGLGGIVLHVLPGPALVVAVVHHLSSGLVEELFAGGEDAAGIGDLVDRLQSVVGRVKAVYSGGMNKFEVLAVVGFHAAVPVGLAAGLIHQLLQIRRLQGRDLVGGQVCDVFSPELPDLVLQFPLGNGHAVVLVGVLGADEPAGLLLPLQGDLLVQLPAGRGGLRYVLLGSVLAVFHLHGEDAVAELLETGILLLLRGRRADQLAVGLHAGLVELLPVEGADDHGVVAFHFLLNFFQDLVGPFGELAVIQLALGSQLLSQAAGIGVLFPVFDVQLVVQLDGVDLLLRQQSDVLIEIVRLVLRHLADLFDLMEVFVHHDGARGSGQTAAAGDVAALFRVLLHAGHALEGPADEAEVGVEIGAAHLIREHRTHAVEQLGAEGWLGLHAFPGDKQSGALPHGGGGILEEFFGRDAGVLVEAVEHVQAVELGVGDEILQLLLGDRGAAVLAAGGVDVAAAEGGLVLPHGLHHPVGEGAHLAVMPLRLADLVVVLGVHSFGQLLISCLERPEGVGLGALLREIVWAAAGRLVGQHSRSGNVVLLAVGPHLVRDLQHVLLHLRREEFRDRAHQRTAVGSLEAAVERCDVVEGIMVDADMVAVHFWQLGGVFSALICIDEGVDFRVLQALQAILEKLVHTVVVIQGLV